MNLYNKAYTSMKGTLSHFNTPEEAIACYFEGAAKYLAKAEIAARENRIEDRSNLSDKALLIFGGILIHFDEASPEEKKKLKGLLDYCKLMNDLILRMNMKNDVEMAASLATEIKRMAIHWRAKGESIFLETSHNDTTPYPVPHSLAPPDFERA